MGTVDSSFEDSSLTSVWRALTSRLAVAVGATTALLSLIANTPVWVASLRGVVAWLALVLIAKCFGFAFDEPADPETEAEEATTTE